MWLGESWLGMAGTVSHDMARLGSARFCKAGKVRPGLPRPGKVGLGLARLARWVTLWKGQARIGMVAIKLQRGGIYGLSMENRRTHSG